MPKDEIKPQLIMVELNNADTTSLIQLAGIGSVFASRIVKYRDLLGGFDRKEQLLEVYNFSEEIFQRIQNNITVDTTIIQKIRLNFANYTQLLRHPYLNEKDVKLILDYRNKNGSYTSVSQILENNLVDSSTYYSIKPYLSCR
jgi:DNA uptake protein ComE-like DNA-binding protein